MEEEDSQGTMFNMTGKRLPLIEVINRSSGDKSIIMRTIVEGYTRSWNADSSPVIDIKKTSLVDSKGNYVVYLPKKRARPRCSAEKYASNVWLALQQYLVEHINSRNSISFIEGNIVRLSEVLGTNGSSLCIVRLNGSIRTLKETYDRPDFPKAFNEEVYLLNKSKHKNIAYSEGIIHFQSRPQLVLPHITMTLDYYIRNCSLELEYKEKLEIFTQIYNSLQFLRAKQIIHCNVSPLTTYMTPEWRPLLSDFDYARNAEIIKELPGILSPYTPPEISLGNPHPNSDFYSLGKILRFIFTKSPLSIIDDRRMEELARALEIDNPAQRPFNSIAELFI